MRKFAIYILVLLLVATMGGGLTSAAFAASTEYTGPLEDLQQDPDFDVGQYPLVSGDHSIDVIQIAEGAGDELFVYVYQPCGDAVTASSINICQDAPEQSERHWYNYKLQLIALDGALGKYMVEGFTLRTALLRYYDISAIYRLPFGSELTSTLPNGDKTDEVSYEVARCYMAVTVDGKVQYAEQHSEVVTVTNKTVGFVRYYDGFAWITAYTDSHFVAFTCDRDMAKLYEADVFFVRQDYEVVHDGLFGDHYKYDDAIDDTRTLYAEREHSNDSFGLFSNKYTWKEIESVSEFLKETNLTDDARDAVKDMDWVLRFYESPFMQGGAGLARTEYATQVSDVTILRLKFEVNGVVYNLGVVDNKQEGDRNPDNTDTDPDPLAGWKEFVKSWNEFWGSVRDFFQSHMWILWLLGALLLFGILSIFFPVLRVVFKGIWIGLKWLVKILWYIISAPVRLVVWIVNKAKGRKG